MTQTPFHLSQWLIYGGARGHRPPSKPDNYIHLSLLIIDTAVVLNQLCGTF